MRVFMDFEASSLGKHSYPVEIAWLFEDGRARSFLIRPEAHWTDWSAEAEAIHGLSRAQLHAEGEPAGVIVDEMLATLSGEDLYASSPSWDGQGLSVLLRAAGRPRHAWSRASSQGRNRKPSSTAPCPTPGSNSTDSTGYASRPGPFPASGDRRREA